MSKKIQICSAILISLVLSTCSLAPNERTISGNWFFLTDSQYEEEYISDSRNRFMLASAGLIQETTYKIANDTIFSLLLGNFVPVSRIIKLTGDSLVVEIIPVGIPDITLTPLKKSHRKMKRIKDGELGFYDLPADSSRKSRTEAHYYRRYHKFYVDQGLMRQEEYDSLENSGAFELRK